MSADSPGLSDAEFERLSDLSGRASLSDSEMEEYAALDARGAAKAAPQDAPVDPAIEAAIARGEEEIRNAPRSPRIVPPVGSDLYRWDDMTPDEQAQTRRARQEQSDRVSEARTKEAGVPGRVAGLFPQRPAMGSLDQLGANALQLAAAPFALASPVAAPVTAAAVAGPEPVRKGIEGVFHAIDENVAQPLSVGLGREERTPGMPGTTIVPSETVRTAANLAAPAAAGMAAAPLARAVGGRVATLRANRVPLAEIPAEPVGSVRGAPTPGAEPLRGGPPAALDRTQPLAAGVLDPASFASSQLGKGLAKAGEPGVAGALVKAVKGDPIPGLKPALYKELLGLRDRAAAEVPATVPAAPRYGGGLSTVSEGTPTTLAVDPAAMTGKATRLGRTSAEATLAQPGAQAGPAMETAGRPGATQVRGSVEFAPPPGATLRASSGGAIEPSLTGRGQTPPPRVPGGPSAAEAPPAATTEAPTTPPRQPPGWFDRLTQRTAASFRRFGQPGEKLAADVEKANDLGKQYANAALVPVEQAIRRTAGIDPRRYSALRNLGEWVEGTAPAPAWAEPIVESVRRHVSTEMGKRLVDSGVRIVEADGTVRPIRPGWREFFPIITTEGWVQGLYKEAAAGHRGPTPHLDAMQAANPGVNIRDLFARDAQSAAGQPTGAPGRRVVHAESFHAGSEMPRTLNWPRQARDMSPEALRIYAERAGRNAAEHEVFRYRYEGGAKTEGRLREHLDAIRDDASWNADPMVRARGARDAELWATRALGRGDKLSPGWSKVAGVTRAYTTGRLLSGNIINTLQQGSQQINNAAFLGTGNTLRAAGRVLGEELRGATRSEYGPSTLRAMEKGAYSPRTFYEAQDMHQGLRTTRGLLRILSKPAEFIDRISRVTTSEAADLARTEITTKLRGGGRGAADAQQFLRDMDIAEADIAALRSGSTADPTLANRFSQRLTSYLNIENGVADRPTWASGAVVGNFAYTFKQYPVRAAVLARDAVRRAYRGNPAPLVKLAVGSIVFGDALRRTSNALYGPRAGGAMDPEEAIEKRDFPALVYGVANDLALSGFGGQAATTGQSALPDESGKMHLVEAGTRTILAPWAGSLVNAGRAIEAGVTRNTKGDVAESAARRGSLPSSANMRNAPADRGDAWEEAFWTLLKREMVQVTKNVDMVRMRTDPAYRNRVARELFKVSGGPKVGLQARAEWAAELAGTEK